jgi:hypothetical protein
MKFEYRDNWVRSTFGPLVNLPEVAVISEEREETGTISRWHNDEMAYHLEGGGFISFADMEELVRNKSKIARMLPKRPQPEKAACKPKASKKVAKRPRKTSSFKY